MRNGAYVRAVFFFFLLFLFSFCLLRQGREIDRRARANLAPCACQSLGKFSESGGIVPRDFRRSEVQSEEYRVKRLCPLTGPVSYARFRRDHNRSVSRNKIRRLGFNSRLRSNPLLLQHRLTPPLFSYVARERILYIHGRVQPGSLYLPVTSMTIVTRVLRVPGVPSVLDAARGTSRRLARTRDLRAFFATSRY